MKTTYIVSGWQRSGTSMIMRALIMGGLEGAYDPKLDKSLSRWGSPGYNVNPYGFFELEYTERSVSDFPAKYEGKVVKLLIAGLKRIILGNYKIVFMMRDPREIEKSLSLLFTKTVHLPAENYYKECKDVLAFMYNRKDVDMVIFWYPHVIEEPLHHMQLLKKRRWRIDPVKAAEAIDPKLYRNRC